MDKILNEMEGWKCALEKFTWFYRMILDDISYTKVF